MEKYNELQFIYPNVSTLEDLMFDKAPKVLDGDKYKELSLGAKYLYIKLRSRQQLSIKNNWIDEKGQPYCIFTNDNIADLLNISKPTVIKFKKELIKFQLLKEVRRGVQKTNILYVGEPNFTQEDLYNIVKKEEESYPQETNDESYPQAETIENTMKLKNFNSRSKESLIQEVNFFNPSKIDFNKIDSINNQSINQKKNIEDKKETEKNINKKNDRLIDETKTKINSISELSNKYNSDILTIAMQKANKAKQAGILINNLYAYLDKICQETMIEDEMLNKDENKTNQNYKKTKFHNFKQRTDNYTASELEEIARRKQIEYDKRIEERNKILRKELEEKEKNKIHRRY